jgi:GNAT superfamily N-acetyltransferase
VICSLATAAAPDLESLWAQAREATLGQRGGAELLATMGDEGPATDFLDYLLKAGRIWLAHDGDVLKGLAVCHDRVVQILYVDPRHRREGVARSLVESLRTLANTPLDAYALPGDRATKSLYESCGWKARLLTMRGE